MNFWSQFPQAGCLPDCNCEMIHSGWICQPSAFWSSLIYFLAAWWLWKKVKDKSPVFKLWTGVVVTQGLFSMLAHGTFLKLALSLDFAGIVVLISFFTMLKFFRKSSVKYFVIYFTLLLLYFYYVALWLKVALCVVIFIISIADIIRTLKGEFKHSRTLHQALYILVGSFVFFVVDETKMVCDPTSWIQGHSVWHIGSALAVYYYGKWRFVDIHLRNTPLV